MAYCGPRALPLHKFLSWPPESQEAALAWQSHEAQRCNGCGTHRDEWHADGKPKVAHHWTEEVCPGCQRLARAREGLASDQNAPRGAALVMHDGSPRDCPHCPTT